jgi:hypothetical protein
VGQKGLLLLSVALGGAAQPVTDFFDISSVSTILSCLFLLLLTQEVWIIQWKMRDENVEFTRRFNRKYPPGEFSLVRIGPHLIGSLGVVLFIGVLGLPTNAVSIHAVVTIFFILKWISDPLLGILAEYHNRLLQPVFAYVVIFIYATTSSVESEILELTPIPWAQSVTLVLFFFAVLQMRMAYYQKFCFRSEMSVDGQLNLVLLSLLFLSLPGLAYAIDVLTAELR